MPQKANPFFAESSEALQSILRGMINPIKEMIVAYREQGDLRRSITLREGYHPIMLSIISIERLIGEINKYDPNPIELEKEIYVAGPKIISSAIQTYLKAQGVSDAYDRIKEVVMNPFVKPEMLKDPIFKLMTDGKITSIQAEHIAKMIGSVMDNKNLLVRLENEYQTNMSGMLELFTEENKHPSRKIVLGKAKEYTQRIAQSIQEATNRSLIERYHSDV